MCKMMSLERRCSDGAGKLRAALESQLLHSDLSGADVWDKTVAFFAVKKALLLSPGGYSKSSRDAIRFFPKASEDVAPLCCQ